MRDRPTNIRYIVLFGLCLAAGLAYVHRGCLSVVESTVREDLDVTPRAMGGVFSAFFWAYALFQIPTGLLVDRWGPRRALFLFGLLGAATMALSAGRALTDTGTGFIILFLARLLMGVAQAGLFPASTRAMSVWIPLRRRAFAAGILQACMSLGGAIGAYTTAQLLKVVSWPTIFVIYAIPGLIWSAWFFAWYRDRPSEHASTNEAERELLRADSARSSPPSVGWSEVALSWPVILLCAQQFCRAAAAVFWFSWCPTYLQQVYQLDPSSAGKLTSALIVGFMLGSLGGGWIADRILAHTGSRRKSRAGTAIGATGLGVGFFALSYLAPREQPALAVAMLILAATVTAGGNSCSYSIAMDLGGRNLATVFGAMNMFGNFGAAVFAQVAPEWVGWLGWPGLLLLVGGLYLLAVVFWLPLNPDRRTARDDFVPGGRSYTP
jgi:ACS family glucarate transporter-like MFS transporter